MKTRDEFVAEREGAWRELDQLVSPAIHHDGEQIARAAALYRQLCSDVMRCRARRFGADLQHKLDALAARSHNFLYRAPTQETSRQLYATFLLFPQTVRQEWPFVSLASLTFVVPFLFGLLSALYVPDFAEKVLPSETLSSMASAYSEGFDAGRASGQDATMTGFYVWNNVGIAFRCFATGIVFGVGSLFYLTYNGLVTGVVVGYVSQQGYAANIWTFMCGHAACELGAIMLCGAAGFKLGYALIATEGASRLDSVRRAATPALTLVAGSAGLLTVAALLEGFWSPSSAPAPVKWMMGALIALGLLLYLALAGRGKEYRLEPR